MVIDVNTPESTRFRAPRFRPDTVTLKLVAFFLLGVSFVGAGAYIRNGQRNLAEDIRREEARQEDLRRDLNAEKSLWSKSNTPQAIGEKLVSLGCSMAFPQDSQIVYVTPAAGRPRGMFGIQAPSAVAAR